MKTKIKRGRNHHIVETIVTDGEGTILDKQVTHTSTTFTAKVESERFFFIYTAFITMLKDSKDQPSRTALAVFAHLLERYHPSGIAIVKDQKEYIANQLGITVRYVDKCLKELVTCNLLIKKGRSSYTINPLYVYQGRSDERKNIIEVTFK